MTQQYQPQGSGVSQSQSVGGQSGQQIQPAHFDEDLQSEPRAALEDLSWLRKQTKWAAQQAHVKLQGTGVETTLEAISEIAELTEELILGKSKFVPYYADTFRQVAADAIQELQQFQQEPFVEAVISDLTRAIHSIEELLATVGQTGQQTGGQVTGQGQSVGMQGQQSQIPQQGQSQMQSQPQTGGQSFTGSQF